MSTPKILSIQKETKRLYLALAVLRSQFSKQIASQIFDNSKREISMRKKQTSQQWKHFMAIFFFSFFFSDCNADKLKFLRSNIRVELDSSTIELYKRKTIYVLGGWPVLGVMSYPYILLIWIGPNIIKEYLSIVLEYQSAGLI